MLAVLIVEIVRCLKLGDKSARITPIEGCFTSSRTYGVLEATG